MLDRVEMQLRGADGLLPVYFDVYDNSLSRKWLSAFNNILDGRASDLRSAVLCRESPQQ